MGGYIAVGVIDEDGRIETVVGRTNALPKTFKNADFIAGDHSALMEYVDYFRHNRHDEGYGPSDNVPSEYGYLLFDLRERAILSAQDYTSVLTLIGPEVSTDAAARAVNARRTHDDTGNIMTAPAGPYGSLEAFTSDLSNDPRGGVETYGQILESILALVPADGRGSATPMDIIERTFDSLPDEKRNDIVARLEKCRNVDENAPLMFTYGIDYGDWHVEDGRRNTSDLSAVRDYINERFGLSADEASQWERYLEPLIGEAEVGDSAGPKTGH